MYITPLIINIFKIGKGIQNVETLHIIDIEVHVIWDTLICIITPQTVHEWENTHPIILNKTLKSYNLHVVLFKYII